jgi:toxin secretion/phage lysis holin
MYDWGTIYRTVAATCGAAAGYFLGGWTAVLGVLLAFVSFDYLTGVLASAAEGKLSSLIGFIGIAKKVAIFFLVAVAHLCDVAAGSGDVVRDATIFFYLANELISIIENCGRLGLPVPDIIQQAVGVLKGKGKGGLNG